jgi:uncharacterized membrane protein YhaH (DUF805 family)
MLDNLFQPMHLLVILVIVFLAGIWMVVFHRAGYSAWWGLLVYVPLVGLFAIGFLMFREWPIQREARELRQRLAHYEGLTPVL